MANFNRLYKEYLISFDKEKAKQMEKGRPVYDNEPLTRTEFESHFYAIQNDMKEAGRTITPDKTIKALTEKQVFSRSLAQAQKLKKAMADRGLNISIAEARTYGGVGDDEEYAAAVRKYGKIPEDFQKFWQEVDAYKQQQIALGKTKAEIRTLIAIEFFGS